MLYLQSPLLLLNLLQRLLAVDLPSAEGRVKIRYGVIAALNTLTVALRLLCVSIPYMSLTLADLSRLLRRKNLPERLW
jgi:hypothetical protein